MGFSALHYIGGKNFAAEFILSRFPDNVDLLVEGMCGGASITIASIINKKAKDNWIIDKDPYLMNFWRRVRSTPDREEIKEFCQAWLALHKDDKKDLYNRYKYHISQPALFDKLNNLDAAKYFFVNRCSFSGAGVRAGFGGSKFTQSSIDKIDKVAEVLRNTAVGCADIMSNEPLDFYLRTWPDSHVLIYLDPPYLLPKGKNKLYKDHETFDHEVFAEKVKSFDAKVLLSYNDCDSIRELYKDWTIESYDLTYGSKNKDKVGKELLIRNY